MAINDFEIRGGVLVSYLGAGREIHIPDEVVTIGIDAFANLDEITKVIWLNSPKPDMS